jgi:hypothetical protein
MLIFHDYKKYLNELLAIMYINKSCNLQQLDVNTMCADAA